MPADPDLLTVQAEWEVLHRKSLKEELSKDELKRAIELVRTLRQTNTGPARKKRTNRGPLSDDALDAILKG